MSRAKHDPANDYKHERNFDVEFEIFFLEHQLSVSMEEVYHLAPYGQSTDEIRQHNHAILRSGRTKRSLTLCATTMNWEGNTIPHALVLANLAGEARLFLECEGDFQQWVSTFELDPDSRSAERRFKQTAVVSEALRSLVGDGGFDQLLELSGEAADAFSAIDADDD